MDKWNRIWLAVLLVLGLDLSIKPAAAADGSGLPPLPATVTVTTNLPATNPPVVTAQEIVARNNEENLRSYLRLQEQLHTALLAIQQSRDEASAEAQTNVSALVNRLEGLEKELTEQRARQLRSAEDSNRLMMFAAAGILLVGVLAMVFTAVFQAKGMNRLAEIATGISPVRGLSGAPGSLQLGDGDRLLLGAGEATGNDGIRLQSTIRKLEGRIREIEVTAHAEGDDGNGHPVKGGAPTAGATSRALILAKAQALLNLGKHEAAVTVLDEAIENDPEDAELHLKKGMALERLKRFDHALDAYDQAIKLDGRCTQAYLSKGGVLNQQERYQEALICYEQALESRPR